ncbi:MAG: tetratricopeptide repeat protein, partial [Verrucomicrobiota bacterium]
MEVGGETATIRGMVQRLRFALCALFCGLGTVFAQDEPAGDVGAVIGVDPKSLTASELYEQGRQAYSRQEFPLAEALLLELIASYGQNAELKEAIDKVKPLVALAQLRQKKFEEALPSIESAIEAGGMPPEVVAELEFWRGLCLMQIGSYVPAQHAFGEFYQKYHGKEGRTRKELMRAHEALLLFAAAYVAKDEKEYGELIAMLNHVLPKLRLESKEAAARATVLLMHSLVESEQFDEAFELVKVQFQDLEAVTQLIALQSMALQVGSNYLEQGEYYKAIACLQRIWLRDRLLRHQRDRLADLEEKMEILQSRRGMQDFVFQYDGMIRRVTLEIEAFEKIEDYDAALRLRLANAFVGLQRYWEAALVLEDMLVNMPRGPIVEQASLSWIQCWMQCARWDKAVAAADIYLEKFDNSDQDERVPTVLMLKADSYREMPERAKAREVYAEVVERFPTGTLAPRALFMQGILYLEDDENDKAIAAFDEVRERFGSNGIAEDAHYWKGMASS